MASTHFLHTWATEGCSLVSCLALNLWEEPSDTRGEEVESENAPCLQLLVILHWYTSPHYIFRSFFSLISAAATSSLCVSPKVEQCVYLVSPREPYHFFWIPFLWFSLRPQLSDWAQEKLWFSRWPRFFSLLAWEQCILVVSYSLMGNGTLRNLMSFKFKICPKSDHISPSLPLSLWSHLSSSFFHIITEVF